MKTTGIILTSDELNQIISLVKRAEDAPVVGYGATGLVTMSQMAWQDAHKAVNAAAVAHGLPDGSFYYSMNHAGELLVPDGYEAEFDKLTLKQ